MWILRMLVRRYGKYVIWLVVVAFLVGGIFLFTPGTFNVQLFNREAGEAAAEVNGDKITQEAFNKAYENWVEQYRRFYQQFGQDFEKQLEGAEGARYQLELKSQVIEQLIRNVLLTQEARKRGLKAPRAQLKQRFEEQYNSILANAGLTERQAEEILNQQGLSLAQFKAELRRQIELEILEGKLKEDVVGELSPTDEELKDYFKQNESKYSKPERVRARHILIKVAQDAPEAEVAEARKKIEEIKKQLDAGGDFAELAKKYSQDEGSAQLGGDLGFFERGRMVKEFEEAAFALKPGEMSDIIRSPFGFHIIKLEEREEGENKKFEDVKEQVKNDWSDEQKRKRFEDWLKDVKDRAKIEIKLPVLRAYMLEKSGTPEAKAKALEEYERIANEGLSDDPYINYHIAKLYQDKQREAQQRKTELEKQQGQEGIEAKIKEVEAEIEQNKRKAIENLLKIAEGGQGDKSIFEMILGMDEKDATVHYQYALMLQAQGDRGDALKHLKRALELNPDLSGALTAYADMMMEQKNYDLAIENYEKALAQLEKQEQKTPIKSVTIKLGEAYLDSGNLEKARELFNKILQDDPRNIEVLSLLGDASTKAADFTAAEKYYKDALNAGAKSDVRVKLAQTYMKESKLAEAEKEFLEVKARSPYFGEVYLGLGDIYRFRGENEKALKEYREGFKRAATELRPTLGERILELEPSDIETRLKLANQYREQHIFEAAIKHFSAVLDYEPKSIEAYEGLGDSYKGRAQYGEAKLYYKSALTLAKADDKKIELYEKLLETDRSMGLSEDGLEALYNLAELYYQKGNITEANSQLEQLKKEAPEYRAQEVAKLLGKLEGRLGPDGKPGRPVEIQGAQHVQKGEPHPPYNSKPPTSGWHYGEEAEWGIHAEQIPDEKQVHNLEHGGVLVQYDPEKADEELIEQLEAVVREYGAKYGKLILAPYAGLNKTVALTAWGRIDEFDGFDRLRIVAFIEEFINKGPEQLPYSGKEWWREESK